MRCRGRNGAGRAVLAEWHGDGKHGLGWQPDQQKRDNEGSKRKHGRYYSHTGADFARIKLTPRKDFLRGISSGWRSSHHAFHDLNRYLAARCHIALLRLQDDEAVGVRHGFENAGALSAGGAHAPAAIRAWA